MGSAKVGVKVAVKKPSVAVKIPSVKVSAGTTGKTAASASVKATVPKVSVTVPKVTVKANVPKVTTPKISGKVTAGTKAGAKATVKDATVDLTGSCPQAKWMGLTTVATVASKGLTICKDMKSTCCDAASMTSYKNKFDAYTKRVSAMMWSMGKLPLMNVAALAELSDKMNMPSKTPVAPAATDKKRRLQSLTAKAAVKAPKASVKVTVPKVAVKAAVKVPKVSVPKVSVTVPKVAVKAGVKSAVTVPKVAV